MRFAFTARTRGLVSASHVNWLAHMQARVILPLLLVAIPAESPRRWRLGQQGGEDESHEQGVRSLLPFPDVIRVAASQLRRSARSMSGWFG